MQPYLLTRAVTNFTGVYEASSPAGCEQLATGIMSGSDVDQAMRRFLTTAAAVLLAGPAWAQVDPKVAAQCKDARDFVGCVKAFTTPSIQASDELTALRGAMKQVAARLTSGTNLRDSTITFQPVVDALALVEGSYPDSLAVQKASLASRLFNVMQSAWDLQIRAKSYQLSEYMKGEDVYACEVLKQSADAFNSAYGSSAINWNYTKGLFGLSVCRVPYGQLPLDYMYPVVIRILNEGSISPEEIASREVQSKQADAKRKREEEMARMEPWERHLEKNPKLKEWVNANPKVAEIEKAKFLGRQSKPEAIIPPSGTTWKW